MELLALHKAIKKPPRSDERDGELFCGTDGASFVLTGTSGSNWYAQIYVNAIIDNVVNYLASAWAASWSMTLKEFTFTKYGGSNNLYITPAYDCKFYNTSGGLVANLSKGVATNVGTYAGFIIPA